MHAVASLASALLATAVIASVVAWHAHIPLLNTLSNAQLPLSLFVFVLVSSCTRRLSDKGRRDRPTQSEIFRCVRAIVSELYVVFLLLFVAKAGLALAPK